MPVAAPFAPLLDRAPCRALQKKQTNRSQDVHRFRSSPISRQHWQMTDLTLLHRLSWMHRTMSLTLRSMLSGSFRPRRRLMEDAGLLSRHSVTSPCPSSSSPRRPGWSSRAWSSATSAS